MNNISIKRLLKDIKELEKNPLENDGIFYKHDEDNLFKGYALIFGPKDTLYENGCYFFSFNFTKNYPFEPPTVKFLTCDNFTRFHPNLYRNGKVCLSILNTWKGEQWTSCQSIRSVLLTIISLFDNKPLLHEPGITEKYKDFKKYNEIILFKNIQIAIIKYYNKRTIKALFNDKNIYSFFYNIIKKKYAESKDEIIKKINENLKEKSFRCKTSIYNMDFNLDYLDLSQRFLKLKVYSF